MKRGTAVPTFHGLRTKPASVNHGPCLIVYRDETAAWIKMPLDTEVGVVPGDIVLDGDPAPHRKGCPPIFRPMTVVAKCLEGSRCHLVVGTEIASDQATLS